MSNNSCDFCKGTKCVFLIEECHHIICEDCINSKKLKIKDQCPFIRKIDVGDKKCERCIFAFIPIVSEVSIILSDLKKEMNLELQIELVEKAKKEANNFANNILAASNSVFEQTIKDLDFQQETIKTQMKELEKACGLLKEELEKIRTKQSLSETDTEFLDGQIQEVYA
jgi:hypothetical protein